MENINSFKVHRLHNKKRSLEILFSENKLILVGENGSGKTTILRLFYYLISGQFPLVAKFHFDLLSITIDGVVYTLSYDEISTYVNFSKLAIEGSHIRINHNLIDMWYDVGPDDSNFIKYINSHVLKFDDEEIRKKSSVIHKQISTVSKFKDEIVDKIDFQVLYLPTYRRIEQELQFIFKDFDDSQAKRRVFNKEYRKQESCVELVEFGMRDVQQMIEASLMNLNRTARIRLNKLSVEYLSDIIEQKYNDTDLQPIKSATTQTIENVLNRIQESALSRDNKRQLYSSIEKVKSGDELSQHDKIVCHYFTKVLKIQKYIQRIEDNITKFCDVCNSYMVNKYFTYSSSDFSLKICQVDQNKESTIELHQLSSGEKQIASLFCHLYLSGGKKYFVIIDEPELSLSVEWQRKFLLDIAMGGFCSGLFAVTHSPFIYDNALRPYAHGIEEFLL